MDRAELKLILEKIGKDDFQIGKNMDFEYINNAMIDHIGDLDPSLRDSLICDTFYEWLADDARYNPDLLLQMLRRLTSEECLFRGLDKPDNVYTRTFSSLIIGQIIEYHRRKPFLSADELHDLTDIIHKYCRYESVFSGYHERYGWAHAGAHTADVIGALANCAELGTNELESLLDCIDIILCNGCQMLSHEEDERLSRAAVMIYKNKIMNSKIFARWLEHLSTYTSGVEDMNLYRNCVNAKNFTRAMYFKALHFNMDEGLINTLLEVEKKLNRYAVIDRKYFMQE